MKTNDLISLMAQDSTVRMRLGRLLGFALVVGIVASSTFLLSTVGVRPDMASAITTPRVLFKLSVTLSLAIVACNLVFRIGRPEAALKRSAWSLLMPLAALATASASELALVPQEEWKARMIGHHAAFCIFFIPVLSVVPMACLIFALNHGAPESPRRAGAAAGLAAGAIAAAIYAWHCPDDSPLFVVAWYSLAIAIVTCVGAWLGGRALRW